MAAVGRLKVSVSIDDLTLLEDEKNGAQSLVRIDDLTLLVGEKKWGSKY
jgi:hypothetical protein